MPIYYPGTSYTLSFYTQSITAIEIVNLIISWYDITNTKINDITSSSFSTGFTTANNNSATSVSSITYPVANSSIKVGMLVQGTGIPNSTYVTSISSDGTAITVSNVITITAHSTITYTNAWFRPYLTATAPQSAAYATVSLSWNSAANSDVLYIDSALFENTGILQDYFDGGQGPGLIPYDFLWEGNVVNGARSHYYKNRYNVQNRLASSGVLKAQLPAGATSAFYLAQPKT
jgi:hypothetical protein